MGIQFLELFRDNLFFDRALHSNKMADMIREERGKTNVTFLTNSPSSQLFPILPNSLIAELEKKYSFLIWEKVDRDHSAIRLVTSWATKEEEVLGFIEDMNSRFSLPSINCL